MPAWGSTRNRHGAGIELPEARDTATGELLDRPQVEAGGTEETEYMKKVPVWERVTREKAKQYLEGKNVGTVWVIVNKADRVRCRLVAQEFAGKDKRYDLDAGTPPFAATRYVLSDCVSRGRHERPTIKADGHQH